MSKKIYTDIDLNQNEAQNLVVEKTSSFPAGSKNGRLIYHTGFKAVYVCKNESGNTTIKGNWGLSIITIDDIDSGSEVAGRIMVTDGTGGMVYDNADGGTF